MAIRFLAPAQRGLRKHRNAAPRILEKIQELAIDPDSLVNNVTRLKGRPDSRLRVGDFRIIVVFVAGVALLLPLRHDEAVKGDGRALAERMLEFGGRCERLVEAAETARDVRTSDAALAAYRADPDTALTQDEMSELLAAPTPLAFWRRRRGLSQAALAMEIGCKQPYLAQLELGRRKGTRDTYRKLADALRIALDDLEEG